MAEVVLAKMAVEISANVASLLKGTTAAQRQLNSFTNSLSSMAKTVGIAFGIQQVAGFAFEVAKLAGEAEGVRAAFDRLPNSVELMNRLKEATAGTVSELELMKRTIQASNFDIDLEALPKLLEFAAIRAQQTGQSVAVLVDNIVNGIGKKSPLILDNLGISATRLKEALHGVSVETADIGTFSKAVGSIVEEELGKMGGFSENAATKVARLSASWEDFKEVLGSVVLSGGLLEGVLDDLSGILKSLSGGGDQANFIQFQKNLAESIKNDSEPAVKTMMRELNLLRNELKTPISESFAKTLVKDFKLSEEQGERFLKIIKEINGEAKKITPVETVKPVEITTLDSLQEKLKKLNEEFGGIAESNKAELITRGQEIIGIGKQIKALEDLRKEKAKDKEKEQVTPNSVNAYQAAITKLNEELQNLNATDTEQIRIKSAQVAGYQDAIEQVDALKKSFADFDADIVIPTPDLTGLLDGLRTIQETAGALTIDVDVSMMDEVANRFEAGLAKMANSAKTRTQEIKGSFIDLGPLISNSLVGIGEALGGAIAGTESFGDAVLKVVVGFAKQLGEILIATGVGMLAVDALISNPYTAIIAGVALVALASAAGAAISKAHSGSFGGGAAAGASGGGRGSSSGSMERFSRTPTDQVILVGGEIKWNGNTLALALDRAYKSKERTG